MEVVITRPPPRSENKKTREQPEPEPSAKPRMLDDEYLETVPEIPYRAVPELVHKDVRTVEKPKDNIPVKLVPNNHKASSGEAPKQTKEAIENVIPVKTKERAYKLVKPIDKPGTVDKILKDIWSTKVNMELGDLVQASPEIAERLRKAVTKIRKRSARREFGAEVLQQECAFPYMEDGIDVALEHDALEISDLPMVDCLYIATEEDKELDPNIQVGGTIVPDPYLLYLASLEPDEIPRQVYVANDSEALRSVFPKVNDTGFIESVIDGGSQIVSMALQEAEGLGLHWDTDLQIYMQSANGQLKKSAGLARNVPFQFGDIIVYLQVHIMDKPAYKILLGRPFDILTESQLRTRSDGSMDLLLKDPNTGRKCIIPTKARGAYSDGAENTFPRTIVGVVQNQEELSNNLPKKQSDFAGPTFLPRTKSKKPTVEEVKDEDDPDYSDEEESEPEEEDLEDVQDFRRHSRI